MTNRRFKVGDRVKIVGMGAEGTIKIIHDKTLGVRILGWSGHDLGGELTTQDGWYINYSDATILELSPFEKSLREYIDKELG